MSVPRAPAITAAANFDGTITVKWGDTPNALTHTVSISPGSFASQTVIGRSATFTGANSQTQYTASVYATNANGNSSTNTRYVDDFKRGLIWWIDAADTSTMTFGPNRQAGGYSFQTVTRIADKSGSGTSGNKDATISSNFSPNNILTGATQSGMKTTTTGPVYIPSLTTQIVQSSDIYYYANAPYYSTRNFTPTSGIDRPGLLFRGKVNATTNPSFYDSLQGYCGGQQTYKTSLCFYFVGKDLAHGSFFGSPDDGNSYVGYDHFYGQYGRTGADSLTTSIGPQKSTLNFVIGGLFEQSGTGNLNYNLNGSNVYSGTSDTVRNGFYNFNRMRICGRLNSDTPSGYLNELLLYQRVLTNNEIIHLEGYLATKWNLQNVLPVTHLYHSANNSYPTVAEAKVPPVITNSPNVTIQTIIKNNFTSTGVTINDLITLLDTNYVPTYTNDIKAIAVTDRAVVSAGTWQYSLNDGATWTAFSSGLNISSQVILLSGTHRIRFNPATNYTGNSSSLPFVAWDGTGATSGTLLTTVSVPKFSVFQQLNVMGSTYGYATVVINTTGPITPPSLNNSPNVGLTSINEDVTNPTGTSVASLITTLGSNYVVGGAITKGIAIYNAPSTNGNWQFSTNSGGSWTNITGLSAVNHLILTATGSTNMVRFVPAANFNGTSVFSFRAWDSATGTPGTVVAVNSPGGTSGYSTGTGTVTITVNPVNDAPVMTGGYAFSALNALTTAELAPVSIETMLTSFVLTDADISNAQSITSVAIIGAEDVFGTWYYSRDNQTTWVTLTGTTAAAAVHFNRDGSEFVKFVPVSTEISGNTYLQVRAWDKTNAGSITNGIGNASTGGATTAYSTNTPFMNCAVMNLPSAPGSFTVLNKGGPIGGIELSWSVPSNTGNSAITTYTIYTIDETNTATVVTTSASTSATITADLVLGNTYIYTVSATNSVGESPQTASASVVYRGAPELVDGTTTTLSTILEDATSPAGDTVLSIVNALGSAYTPANTSDTKGIAIYNAPSTNGAWQYSTNSGSSWLTIPSLAETQHFVIRGVVANRLRFVPAANFNGDVVIQFRAWDTKLVADASLQTVTETGALTSYSTGTATASLTIISVKDSPIITGSYSFPTVNAVYDLLSPTSVESILSNYSIAHGDIANAQSVVSMAIIGATTTVGTWYYTRDNQTTWIPITSVTAETAIHLNRTSDEFIQFIPTDTSVYGNVSIQIRAWDKTNAESIVDGVGNASVGGGTTAYSTNTPTISCQIINVPAQPISLAPTNASGGIQLSWTAPAVNGNTPITSYKIYNIDAENNAYLVATVSGTTATITTGITLQESYTYNVNAVNAAGEGPDSSSVTIQYKGAPELVDGSALYLTTIAEDATAPSGDTILSLISALGSAYTPANSADLKGLAIFSAPTTNGIWQYSINSGTSWIAIPAITGLNHFVLSGLASNRIRLLPTTNFNGTASIEFRAWDVKTGSNATLQSVIAVGDLTSYSTGTGSAEITVTPVNDAPTLSGSYSFSTLNATDGTFTPVSVESIVSSLIITDPEDTNAQPNSGLAIVSANTSLGTWYYSTDNQATWVAMSSISASSAVHLYRTADEFIKFVPTNGNTSGTSSIQIRSWDKTNSGSIVNNIGNASSTGTTTPYSSAALTLNCVVICVSSAPTTVSATNLNGGVQVSWSAPSTIGGSAITSYNVYLIDGSGNASLLTNVSTTSAAISSGITLGSSYVYSVSAINGAGESTQSSTVTIVYRGAPEITSGTNVNITTISEDSTNPTGDTLAAIITSVGSAYVPANTSDSRGIAVISAPTTNGVWQYSINSGSSWVAIPSLTGTNHFLLSGLATNRLRFIPSTNFFGTETLQFRAWDLKTGTNATTVAVASTGALTSYGENTATIQISVTNVNDAPILTGTYSFSQLNATNGSFTPISIDSLVTNFTITDADLSNSTAQSVTGIAIIAVNTSIGAWQYSIDNQATWIPMTTVSAASAVHLDRTDYIKFLPSTITSNGTTSIQIRAWDKTNIGSLTNRIGNASTGGSTTAYSTNTPTLNCQVVSATSAPQSLAHTLTGAGLSLTWNAPSNLGGLIITGYNVYNNIGGALTLLTTVATTSAIVTLGLTPGTLHTISVTAVNSAGESAAANVSIQYAVNPQPPTSVTTVGSNAQVSLTWTAPSNNGGAAITGYKIYNATTESLLKTVANITATTVTNLNNYPVYFFKIKSINAANLESDFSEVSLAMPTGVVEPSTPAVIQSSMQTVLATSSAPVTTVAAVINSIAFTNTSDDKTILNAIVKSSLEIITDSVNLTQIISTAITTAASVVSNITSSTKKEAAVESISNIMASNAILASSPSDTRAATVATTIVNTITAIASSSLSSYKELAIATAAATILGNVDLPTATAVAAAIVMGTTDPSLKTGVFATLANIKESQSIVLSGADAAAIKDSVTYSNKTVEFTTITNLGVNIPNAEHVIDITNEPIDRPIFLPMEPDVDYTIIYKEGSRLMRYNSSNGLIYSQTRPILLGYQVAIGGTSFKIIQKGTTTLMYNGPEDTNIYVPCIVKGQKILTPDGEVAVETLKDGDLILTSDNRQVPVRIYTHTIDKTDNVTAPIEISAGAFGPNMPPRNLQVSPLHAVYKGNNLWEIPYAAAKRYKGVKQMPFRQEVTYYHVETPNYMTDHLVVEGCVIESFGGNYVKQHGLRNVEMYTWSPRKNGFVRYNPSQQKSVTK